MPKRNLAAVLLSIALAACLGPESAGSDDPSGKESAKAMEDTPDIWSAADPVTPPQMDSVGDVAAEDAAAHDAAISDAAEGGDGNQACAGVDTRLTGARVEEYARLVSGALSHKTKPSTVKVVKFMESGAWSAVYATTPISDAGVLFFRTVNGKKRFKDVWGGMAVEEDRPELVEWAEGLGAPQELAGCFADTVIVR